MTTNRDNPSPLEPVEFSPTQIEAFVEAAAERLDLTITPAERAGRLRLSIPPARRAAFGDRREVEYTLDKAVFDAALETPVEFLTPGSRLMAQLIDQVRTLGSAAHAAPRIQPTAIREVSERLFGAYTVDGGRVQLEGCTLEDRPILRLTCRVRIEGLEPRDELFDVCVDDQGRAVSQETALELGLDDLIDPPQPPRFDAATLTAMMTAARTAAEDRCEARRLTVQTELNEQREAEEEQLRRYFKASREQLLAKLEDEDDADRGRALREQIDQLAETEQRRLQGVQDRYACTVTETITAAVAAWCKYTAGKLRFRIGEASCKVGFADWAASLTAPPITCPTTGVATFHIAAVDDGRIVAFEQIGRCQVSGVSAPNDELLHCTATGKTALAKFFGRCAATGDDILTDALIECRCCRQSVAPLQLRGDACLACRPLVALKPGSDELRALFAARPSLARWGRWKKAEGAAAQFFTASRWLGNLRLLFDLRTPRILWAATRTGPFGSWSELDLNELA